MQDLQDPCYPVLLYGCETLAFNQTDMEALEVFHMRCLRKIAGISRIQMIRNDDIRPQCGGIKTVERMIKEDTLCWLGHVGRMSDARITKEVMRKVMRLVAEEEKGGIPFRGPAKF